MLRMDVRIDFRLAARTLDRGLLGNRTAWGFMLLCHILLPVLNTFIRREPGDRPDYPTKCKCRTRYLTLYLKRQAQ